LRCCGWSLQEQNGFLNSSFACTNIMWLCFAHCCSGCWQWCKLLLGASCGG
jgi:hypothetical protein